MSVASRVKSKRKQAQAPPRAASKRLRLNDTPADVEQLLLWVRQSQQWMERSEQRMERSEQLCSSLVRRLEQMGGHVVEPTRPRQPRLADSTSTTTTVRSLRCDM